MTKNCNLPVFSNRLSTQLAASWWVAGVGRCQAGAKQRNRCYANPVELADTGLGFQHGKVSSLLVL